MTRLGTRPMFGAVLAATALLAGLIGWLAVHGTSSTPRDSAANPQATGLTIFRASQRPRLPSAHGTTIDGDEVDLASFEGKFLVLNVWGSWCGPCRAEAPDLAKVANETAPHDVQFIGIDTRDNPAAAQAFVRRYNIPYPSLDDQDGKLLALFAGIVPVNAVPSTLVVAPDGLIAARIVGRVDASTLRGLIDDLQAAGPKSPTSGP